MLHIQDLSVVVDGKRVLNRVELHVPEGELHVLLGPNGSGKSSLLAVVAGYPQYEISGGRINFLGKDLSKLGMTERARLGIGTAEQNPPVIQGVKTRKLFDFILHKYPERRVELRTLICSVGMESILDRNIHEGLSGGESKKLELLLLLARQPIFSMLDEPDSGVDLDSLERISTLIKSLYSPFQGYPARRRTGLIVTHSKKFLESVYADKAHIMLKGELVCSGNPGIIMNRIAQEGFEACVACYERGIHHDGN